MTRLPLHAPALRRRGAPVFAPVPTVLPARAPHEAGTRTARRGPVLVRGVGELASAVAHALFRAGWAVALHTDPGVAPPLRGRCFADALGEGCAELEGVRALRLRGLGDLRGRLATDGAVPVLTQPYEAVAAALRWRAVLDLRDAAVPDGEACMIEAPAGGLFRTLRDVGTLVAERQFVGLVGASVLYAPVTGMLTGLVRDGTLVERGAPLAVVDPQGADARAFGIAGAVRREAERIVAGLGG